MNKRTHSYEKLPLELSVSSSRIGNIIPFPVMTYKSLSSTQNLVNVVRLHLLLVNWKVVQLNTNFHVF